MPSKTPILFGGAAFLLGITVLCGWIWRIPFFVQLYPGFAPMQFNTALGIVAAGLGVMLMERWTRVAVAIGSVVAIWGAVVLVQFTAGVDFGVDQAAFRTWLATDVETPGRMSLNTAVWFVIAGLSLMASIRRSNRWIRWRMLGGMSLICMSIVVLFGYVLGVESALRFGDPTRMAVHTAVSFILLGAGVVGPWKPITDEGWRLAVALSIGFCLAGITLFVWAGMLTEQQDLLRGRLAATSLNDANMLVGGVRHFTDTLERLDKRLTPSCSDNLEACAHELEAYFGDHPPLRRIGWLGRSVPVSMARRETPGEPRAVESSDSYAERLLETGLESAASPHPVAVLLNLPGEQHHLVVAVRSSPAYPALFGSLDLDVFLGLTATPLETGWSRHIWSSSTEIAGAKRTAGSPELLSAQHHVELLGTNWTFAATADRSALRYSPFTDLTLAFGLLMAFSVGSSYLLLGISRERVSELRTANMKLMEETWRAAEANRAKSDFLAVVSHEIRTPMNAILGMTELLQQANLAETERRYANICHRAGEDLLALINDILDLSKIDAARLQVEAAPFRLSDLMKSATDLVGIRVRSKGLALELRTAPGTGEHWIGDLPRLRQILVNLLGNAVKFTESGKITVAIQGPSAGSGGDLRFTVTDTGCGIPDDKLGLIFEPFTQADSSVSRRHGGTGLGLAISRRLAELMGGRLSVTSRLGEGSTFELAVPLEPYFPAEKEPHRGDDSPQAPSGYTTRRALRILVADDSFDNQFLVREYLRASPHELTFVDDGQAAVDHFIAEDYDLILMDVEMPSMDGLTATRSIRQIEREAGLPPAPILAITASARPEDEERTRQAGCTAHLSKPISHQRLLEAIARYAPTEGRRDASAGIQQKLKRMAPVYLAQQRQEFDRMRAYLSASDFEALRRLGHNLRGTGAVYGYPELATLGEAIEVSAANRDSGTIQARLADVEGFLSRAGVDRAE